MGKLIYFGTTNCGRHDSRPFKRFAENDTSRWYIVKAIRESIPICPNLLIRVSWQVIDSFRLSAPIHRAMAPASDSHFPLFTFTTHWQTLVHTSPHQRRFIVRIIHIPLLHDKEQTLRGTTHQGTERNRPLHHSYTAWRRLQFVLQVRKPHVPKPETVCLYRLRETNSQ